MKTKKNLTIRGWVCLASFLAVSFGVRAEEATDKTRDAAPPQVSVSGPDAKARDAVTITMDYPDGYLAQRLGAMQRETQVIGDRVLDRSDMPLGKVDDVLVNLTAGKIYCALVTMGNPEHTIVVPGRSFFPADKAKEVLDIKKDVLKAAPRFSIADWDYAALRKSIGESYAYFNQQPLWEEKAGLGQLNRGGDFIGMEVKDKDNESLGRVMDLMVDLPTARIVYVIVSLDGTDQTRYAVPPQALMLTSDNKVLFLDESKAKVMERAHAGDYFWTEMTEKTWAANAYRAFGVEPDFDTRAKVDPTREFVRAKVEEAPAAPSKAAGKSDAEITRMILTALVQEDIHSAFSRKNFKISTANGHVTLTGKVKNEKQKTELGEVAESVVGPGYVDNQLEAK